jgi:serine/threonine-protein kinase
MASETGQRVGDYEILALLGSGGMGRVYKVRNVISNREEAMKVLLPDFAAEPELAARFMAEIRTLASLEHPNIAQLRTAFQYQNQFVMVMEYVEGTTLEKLTTMTRIPVKHVLDLSTQVLSALSYAHSRGVTHRDIKPANVMITSHGVVKLMDFGIAKSTNDMNLTRPGTTMGSVYYMSPEQVRGGTVDARSDIYSFGVVLYEMLTGKKPFQGDTSYTVLNAQLNETPTPPGEVNHELLPELNAIVLRAMSKNPDLRFQTADEFRNALKAVREAQVPAVGQPTPASQPQLVAPVIAQPFPPPTAQPAAPAEGYAPVNVPPAPPVRNSHRSLWMTLGAVAAVLVLAASAALLPRFFSTHAGEQPATQTPTTTTAQSQPSVTPPDTASAAHPATQPADTTAPSVSSAPAGSGKAGTGQTRMGSGVSGNVSSRPLYPGSKKGGGSAMGTQVSDGSITNPGPPAPSSRSSAPVPSAEEIHQAHDRLMNLDARADSARSGVQQIRSQQQAQGLDIRGDILAAMNRMNGDINAANRALGQNDLQAANEYMDRAEREARTLESFLGR